MRRLTWFEPGAALGPEELTAAERRLGVAFPFDYALLIAAHCGASNPQECEFDYVDRGRACVGNFGGLLSLRAGDTDNVFDSLGWLADQLPPRVIPIVDTGGGDCVCLDYRAGATPTVVYFAHELSDGHSIIPLDATLTDLIERLRAPDDDE